MAKNLKDLEDDEQPVTIPDEESDVSDPVDMSEEPTVDAEVANPPEFGKPNLLSQEDYANKIHAPDKYGQAVERSPASEPTKEDTKVVPSFPSEEQVQKPASSLDRYKQFIDEYKRLQANRSNSDLIAGLAAAGGKIGQSMAGKYSGNFTPDAAGPNLIRQMGERPIQNFEQGLAVQGRGLQLQQEMNSNEPNSPQSIMVRNYLNKTIFKDNPLPNTVSATDAKMLLKTVGRPNQEKALQVSLVNQQTGEKTTGVWHPIQQMFTDLDGRPLNKDWIKDYRAQTFIDPKTNERTGFSAGTGKVTGPLTGPGVNAPIVGAPTDLNQPIDLNRSFLNAQQAKQVDHTRDKFIQEVRDDRNNLNSTDRVIAALTIGKEIGDLPREDQDQLNRAFGQKGHISDQQVNTILGKPDWKNRFANTLSIGMTGKLTDENRQFLLDTLKVIRDQNQQYIDNKSQIYTTNLYNDFKTAPNLQKYKFGPDSAKGLLGVEAARNPQINGPKQDPKIVEYAQDHYQGDYERAKNFLMTQRHYKPQEQ